MNFEDIKNLVVQTRCTRRFKADYKVDTKDIKEIIDLARQISSAKNMQPLKYIIANDKKSFEIVHKPIKWASHLKEWNQSEDEKPSAYIVILNDTSIKGYAMVDLGSSIQTIMLALNAKGLSGCLLASIDKELYKKEFDLAENLEPMLAIAIGKGDEDIKIVDVKKDTNYYRDENDTHCVPKRDLNDILVKVYE